MTINDDHTVTLPSGRRVVVARCVGDEEAVCWRCNQKYFARGEIDTIWTCSVCRTDNYVLQRERARWPKHDNVRTRRIPPPTQRQKKGNRK